MSPCKIIKKETTKYNLFLLKLELSSIVGCEAAVRAKSWPKLRLRLKDYKIVCYKITKTNLLFILFKLFWKLLLLFDRANRNDFSSSSIRCRELSRNIVFVGCGFGLNDHRLVAKSKPPRVNDVSNTESFSDSELREEALIGLKTGLSILVEDFVLCNFVLLAMFVFGTFCTFLTGDLPRFVFLAGIDFEDFEFCFRGVFGSVITRTGLNLTVEVAEFTFFSLVFKAFYDSFL